MFGGKKLKTKTIDDGGLTATWNESFELVDIQKEIKAGKTLLLEA